MISLLLNPRKLNLMGYTYLNGRIYNKKEAI